MRSKFVLVGCAAATLAGCFDEGGDAVQDQAARTMAEGLLAFPDIHNNLESDPAASGVALMAFVKTPVAANNLLAPPFDLAAMDTAMRTVEPDPLPGCFSTMGPAGCDSLTTVAAGCDAGYFNFAGSASRTCSPCENVTGACTYDWDMNVRMLRPPYALHLDTKGPVTVSASQVTVDTYWTFELTVENIRTTAMLYIESCGPATVDPGPPRRLVNSAFVVRDVSPGAVANACARVVFDGQGNPSATRSCNCGD